MDADRTSSGPGEGEQFSDELPPGTQLLRGQYRIERYLNSGGFGVTYLARDSLERRVVIKECFPSAMCCRSRNAVRARSRSNQNEFATVVRLFGQEARRLSKLSHPNIVGVHQVFEDNGTAYMALDHVDGRDLMDVIDEDRHRLGPIEIKQLLIKLLRAVAYVHDHEILHRDISPDNILLTRKGEPILIDFGAAREEASRASRVLSSIHVVKDGYSPQEFYLAGSAQDASSDLYALAATFHHLITGAPPPSSQLRLAALAAKRPDPYRPLLRRVEGYDDFFLEAIDRAIEVFPQDRLGSAQSWIEMIDAETRRRAALARAQADHEIEASICRLVAETNEVVLAARERDAAEAAARKLEPAKKSGRRLPPPEFAEFAELPEEAPVVAVRPAPRAAKRARPDAAAVAAQAPEAAKAARAGTATDAGAELEATPSAEAQAPVRPGLVGRVVSVAFRPFSNRPSRGRGQMREAER